MFDRSDNFKKMLRKDRRDLKKGLKLYKKGKYKEALIIFNALVANNNELSASFANYIKYCENVINTRLSAKDREYEDNVIGRAKRLLLIPFFYMILPLFLIFGEDSYYTPSVEDIIKIIGALIIGWFFIKIDYVKRKIRCKYCGHYTDYVSPNQEFAYKCSNCRRDYPMPSVESDTFQGHLYMYNNGCVTDKVFYEEFEKEHPEIPHSKAADRYIGRSSE